MQKQRVSEMIDTAKSRIQALAAEDLTRELGNGDLTLVDLREPDERARSGAIPGAIHVPRGMLEFTADPDCSDYRAEFQFSRRLVLYCAAGARSALAADVLQAMGYTNVAHLEGGMKAWIAAGGSVSAVDPGPE